MDKGQVIISTLWEMFNKKNWLDTFQMKRELQDYSPSELHCIDYIEKNSDTNVTKLSDKFYMTRSAISKLTKKLIRKNLIESYQKPENKKEIYFRLTPHGKKLYQLHEKIHIQLYERDKDIFQEISDEQFEYIIDFAAKYSQHLDEAIKQQGIDLREQNFDKM